MNNDDLRELYQEIIMQHNKHPNNKGIHGECACRGEGYNPLCGDRVSVCLRMDNKNVIDYIAFEGEGCAISIASASIMTKVLRNKTVTYARDLSRRFQSICTREDANASLDEPEYEDLKLLTSVQHFPARVKCATLVWHTLDNAIKAKEKG